MRLTRTSRNPLLEEGYDSLWAYCQRALLLREGPAALRITSMRALRRFPVLAEMLRDGRLCLSTTRLLEPILTNENAPDLLARAAGKSKADVERLVVMIQPRAVPKEGVRKLPARAAPPSAPALPIAPVEAGAATTDALWPEPVAMPLAPSRVTRPTLRPVAEDTFSLTVTVGAAFMAELDELKALLSHKVAHGHLGTVLREAVRCAIEKHGKRKGAVEPARKVSKKGRATAQLARGRQGARADSGRREARGLQARRGALCLRCPGRPTVREQMEAGAPPHRRRAALGGPSTVDNLSLRCRSHNVFHAEATFGRAHMAQFRRNKPQMGEVADPRTSARRSDTLAEPVLPLEPAATT